MPALPNRVQAGRRLAGYLAHHEGKSPLVLAVPRGGVPVGAEVAQVLDGELGVVVARKIGAPWSRELAIGAVAPDGVPMIDEQMVARLGIPQTEIDRNVKQALDELQHRQERYPSVESRIEGRVVIVVDDGVATGATLRAVLAYVKRRDPEWLCCAIPVGPPATISAIASEVDEVVCPMQPDRFRAVGEWYDDFTQVTDAEVERLLSREP